MTYVITDACTKDANCVAVCPVDCIHPTEDEALFATITQLFVDPIECIDCGACPSECEYNAIFALDDLPADKQEFVAKNKAYYG